MVYILKKINRCALVLSVMMVLLSGCGFYSFTGASIPPEAKTVSVAYIENNAALVQPTLSATLTDALKDRFIGETSLMMIERNGDLRFEGEITDYKTSPEAIQKGQVAALNRLTITVKMRFVNIYDENSNFESSFSAYRTYESSKILSDVEEDLMTEINEELVDKIFNKAVVNW